MRLEGYETEAVLYDAIGHMEADWREGNLGREKCLFFKMQYKIFFVSRNSRRDITYNYVISYFRKESI